jgi:dihydrofolate reductase
MTRKVHLYIATSLDGYIAGPNGEIDWLFSDQDYGYAGFIAGVDTVLMGRRSYETARSFDEWPYPDLACFVFTRGKGQAIDPRVNYVSGTPEAVVGSLRQWSGKDLWLMGGGELVRHFLDARLVDRVTIGLHPIVLGAGLPLFPAGTRRTELRPSQVTPYDSGLLLIEYEVKR